jgi:hypothetical protein
VKGDQSNATVSVNSKNEQGMYEPFIRAANHALCKLSELDVPGLVPSEAGDDLEILFHQNDPSYIYQTHQGEQSVRKPDIVIVSKASAMRVGDCQASDVYDSEKALKKPGKNFEWKELRTTLEFKRTPKKIDKAPQTYVANTTYKIDAGEKFMNYRRETDTSAEEPEANTTPTLTTSAAAGAQKSSNAGKLSSMSNLCFHTNNCNATGGLNQSQQGTSKGENKRAAASHVTSERSIKKARKEPVKLHPVVQNGLYAAEMFAAHFARQSVISYVVKSKLMNYCRSPMPLIAHTRRHNLHLVL